MIDFMISRSYDIKIMTQYERYENVIKTESTNIKNIWFIIFKSNIIP